MAALFVYLQKLVALLLAIFGIFGVNPGAETTVDLYANPASGYNWEYTVDTDGVLILKSNSYKPDISSIESGGGGTQQFIFKAQNSGTVNITFEYTNHIDGTVASRYVYTYNVDEDGNITLLNKNKIGNTFFSSEPVL